MRLGNRTVFYIAWYLGMGIMAASLYFRLHYELFLARVAPHWRFFIDASLWAGLFLVLLSFSLHKVIRIVQRKNGCGSLAAYMLLLLISIGSSFYIPWFVILIPVSVECLILSGIDWVWDRWDTRLAEKPKRKNDEESKGTA